jgi:hypothetical protein
MNWSKSSIISGTGSTTGFDGVGAGAAGGAAAASAGVVDDVFPLVFGASIPPVDVRSSRRDVAASNLFMIDVSAVLASTFDSVGIFDSIVAL